jgi:hypothetical protein
VRLRDLQAFSNAIPMARVSSGENTRPFKYGVIGIDALLYPGGARLWALTFERASRPQSKRKRPYRRTWLILPTRRPRGI